MLFSRLVFFVILLIFISILTVESSKTINDCHQACNKNTKCASKCVECTNKKCKKECKDGFFSKSGSGATKQKCVDCTTQGVAECAKKN
ncbi:unnamed protein product [Meloidogyne enterolobii]|uniref:Uncharacterized protein n=1 Tax=Meloidogyne enterolobii TaxID=390850 RepID=A0ACB0YIU1_MELEN